MNQVLERAELFEPGTVTAGRAAKAAKANLQAGNQQPEVQRIIAKATQALQDNNLFQRFALPLQIGRVFINRYDAGMRYDTHYDDAYIAGIRTDLSFTLFLSEPDSYTGGELELQSPTGSQALKLPAGSAIVYPSSQLHAVLPVERGTRIAIVGWVQSRIKSTEQRQLIFELTNSIQSLANSATSPEPALLQLRHVRNNLIRMWGDG